MNNKTIITCAAGIIGITTLTTTQAVQAEERDFFDDVAAFFSGEDDQALEAEGPGDHMESRSPHKEYPALALDKKEQMKQSSAPKDKASPERYELTTNSERLPFPEHAVPGECYAEMIVPAKFESASERVLESEASSRIEVTPAKYEWVDQKVMVKPAETKLEIVPAKYKTVSEKVLIEAERQETISIPATYKTVTEKVMVKPATKVWMDGEVEVEEPDELSGDIICLIEKPAEYKTVSRKVVDQPARTEVKTIPAQYKTVQKEVLVSAATTREVTIPAQYDTIQVRQEMTPAKTKEIYIEPQYATMTREVLIKPAHTRWERMLCDESVNAELAYEVEDRLKEEGYNPGPIDGVIDPRTESAIEDFQMANNMPIGGLTPDTLVSLGIVEFQDKASPKKVAIAQ